MKAYPNVSKLFSEGFNIFFKEWKLLAGLSTIFTLPIYILLFWTPEEAVGLSILYTALFVLVSPILQIIIASITKERHQNKKTHSWESIKKHIAEKYFEVLGTMILIGLIFLGLIIALLIIVGLLAGLIILLQGMPTSPQDMISVAWIGLGALGVLAAIILAAVFSTYLFFANTIATLTKKVYLDAIKESFALVKTRWWQTLGFIVLFQLCSFVLISIVTAIFMPIDLTFGPSSISFLTQSILQQIIVLPFGVMAILLYLKSK